MLAAVYPEHLPRPAACWLWLALLLAALAGCSQNPEQAAATAVEALLEADQPLAAAEAVKLHLRQHPRSQRLQRLLFIVALRLEQLPEALQAWQALPTDNPCLTEALHEQHPVIRASAAQLIADQNLPISCRALGKALDDSNPTVRRYAATAIGRRRDCPARRDLYRLLQDEVLAVRLAAVNAFAERGESQAAGWLIVQLNSADPQYREAVETALWRVACPENQKVLRQGYAKANPKWQAGIAAALAKLQDRTVLPYLLETAQSGVTNERPQATLLLGHYQERAAHLVLTNLLQDPVLEVREAARQALRQPPTAAPLN